MYFIVNISRPPREVVIGDLNFVLGPNKAIDLEKVRKRSEIEDSHDLKIAIKSRKIQVRHVKEKPAEVITIQQPSAPTGVGADDLAKIRAAVKEELQQELQSQLAQANAMNKLVPELLAAIKQLQSGPSPTALPQSHQSAEEATVQDLPDDKLAEIAARAIAKTTKPMEGNVDYQQSASKDSIKQRVKKFNDLVDG